MIGEKSISVIIPAAGKGKRMNAGINKQLIQVEGKEIITYTIEQFQKLEAIDEIVIVTSEAESKYIYDIKEKNGFDKITRIVIGGKERYHSVYNGLKAINDTCDIVLIHDGARPLVKEKDIVNVIKTVIRSKAAVLGVRVKDTIKVVNSHYEIESTPNRDQLYAIQTPQGFDKNLILSAYNKGMDNNTTVTDDAMMVEYYEGIKVTVVEGDYSNFKITTPDDLAHFKGFLKKV